jgi:integrase
MRRQRGLYRRKGRDGWHAWVRVDGEPRQRKMGTTLIEAQANLKKVRAQGGAPATTTVAQAIAVWCETQLSVSHGSARGRAIVLARAEKYLARFLGFDRVASLGYARLSEYRLWLDTQGLAAQTVHHLMGDLRGLLLFLVRTGRLDRTPFDRALMPRVPQRLARPLLPEEARAVCAIPGELGFQCRLGIGSGFRFSDLCGLDRTHFDGAALVLVAQKTGRVVRVPLDQELADEIRGRIGRLFDRSPNAPGSFNRSVRAASGVAGFHAHRMRHTFANRMRAKGVDIYRIRDLLGHRTVTTTEIYLSSVAAYDPETVQAVTEVVTG